MAKRSASYLKDVFASGNYPKSNDFEDLIDSMGGSTVIGDSSSTVFDNSLPAGTMSIYTNNSSSSTSVSMPTDGGSSIEITVGAYGAAIFIKTASEGSEGWVAVITPIQSGTNNSSSSY